MILHYSGGIALKTQVINVLKQQLAIIRKSKFSVNSNFKLIPSDI